MARDEPVRTITLMFRKKGMSHDDFVRYWAEVHAPLITALPGVTSYVQRRVLPSNQDDNPFEIDGFVILEWESQEAADSAWASAAGKAAMADASLFTSRMNRLHYEDYVVLADRR